MASALLVKKGSAEYKRLFGGKSNFDFPYWYQLYQQTTATGKFGGEKFVVSETVDDKPKGDIIKVQTIDIIWAGNVAKEGKVEVGISYSKEGNPSVAMSFTKADGVKNQEKPCPVTIKKITQETVEESESESHSESSHSESHSETHSEVIGSLKPDKQGLGDGEEQVEYEMVEESHSSASSSSSSSSNSQSKTETVEESKRR
jgi:hypothetical protein